MRGSSASLGWCLSGRVCYSEGLCCPFSDTQENATKPFDPRLAVDTLRMVRTIEIRYVVEQLIVREDVLGASVRVNALVPAHLHNIFRDCSERWEVRATVPYWTPPENNSEMP